MFIDTSTIRCGMQLLLIVDSCRYRCQGVFLSRVRVRILPLKNIPSLMKEGQAFTHIFMHLISHQWRTAIAYIIRVHLLAGSGCMLKETCIIIVFRYFF